MASGDGLLQALLAVQGEAPAIVKDATNPHYKSKYAPLDTIVQTVGPILVKHKLVWTTLPVTEDGSPALTYRLLHAPSGESIEGTMPLLLSKQDAQGQGSAITYARRYALCAVLNLVAEDDDDGARAAARKPAQVEREQLPALTDAKAQKLTADARETYEQIKTIPGGLEQIPPQKFEGWLAGAASSHEELKRLNVYLAARWAEMQESKP